MGILPPDGQLLAVECKTEKGKLSPEQNEFLERVETSGGLALVVRSLNDLITALEEHRKWVETIKLIGHQGRKGR